MEALVNEPATIYGPAEETTLFKSFSAKAFYDDTSTVFTAGPLPGQVWRLLHRLSSIAELPENWDSYGAVLPSGKAINTAKQFLLKNYNLSLPFYFVSPGVNGEIMLEFKEGEKAAELYFNPDHSTELLLYENDDISLEGNLETHFSDLIRFFND